MKTPYEELGSPSREPRSLPGLSWQGYLAPWIGTLVSSKPYFPNESCRRLGELPGQQHHCGGFQASCGSTVSLHLEVDQDCTNTCSIRPVGIQTEQWMGASPSTAALRLHHLASVAVLYIWPGPKVLPVFACIPLISQNGPHHHEERKYSRKDKYLSLSGQQWWMIHLLRESHLSKAICARDSSAAWLTSPQSGPKCFSAVTSSSDHYFWQLLTNTQELPGVGRDTTNCSKP